MMAIQFNEYQPVFTEEILRIVLYGRKSIKNSGESNVRYADNAPDFMPVPRQVTICQSSLPGQGTGVFASSWIRTGTEMGPFIGKVVRTEQIDANQHNRNYWEVFDNRGRVMYYVDGGTDVPASWLTYVQCARSESEQNLEVIQIGQDIFYKAIKDIEPDQELLVWYGPSRSLFLGMPFAEPFNLAAKQQCHEVKANKESPERLQEPSISHGKLKCVLCRRGFNSRSNLRSHMRIHTLEKPFVCKYCNRKFSQSSTLRNHTRLHTGEKPYRCNVCQSSYSQLAGLRAHQRSARHKPLFRANVEAC